jgi:hypothetical protein
VSKADELRLLRDAIKSFPDALAVWSADGKLVAASELYGRLAAAAPGDAAEFQSADGRWLRRTLRRLEGGGSVELIADVSELRGAEQASRFLAYHDQLTGCRTGACSMTACAKRFAWRSAATAWSPR